MLRLMGCTLGYSRGTPRKCGRAGVLTAAFLRSAHLSTSVRLRSDAVNARADDCACALANARADDRRCAVGYELLWVPSSLLSTMGCPFYDPEHRFRAPP
jgi:hypothetical protein